MSFIQTSTRPQIFAWIETHGQFVSYLDGCALFLSVTFSHMMSFANQRQRAGRSPVTFFQCFSIEQVWNFPWCMAMHGMPAGRTPDKVEGWGTKRCSSPIRDVGLICFTKISRGAMEEPRGINENHHSRLDLTAIAMFPPFLIFLSCQISVFHHGWCLDRLNSTAFHQFLHVFPMQTSISLLDSSIFSHQFAQISLFSHGFSHVFHIFPWVFPGISLLPTHPWRAGRIRAEQELRQGPATAVAQGSEATESFELRGHATCATCGRGSMTKRYIMIIICYKLL